MNEKLRKAFDEIHAEEALKRTTKEYLSQQIRKQAEHKSSPYRRLIPVMACLVVMILGFGGYRIYFTPVSVISIDINPSIEWNINRFDRIISVENYNEDGKELSDSLDVTNKNYSEALGLLVDNPVLRTYLSRDESLTITVVNEDGTQNDQMLQTVRSCTSGIENTHCVSAEYEDLEEAHETGLSCGKYNAYLVLKSLDPDITTEEVQQMTMREIQDRIQALSGQDDSTAGSSTGYSGSGHHDEEHGAGNSSSGKGTNGHNRQQNHE